MGYFDNLEKTFQKWWCGNNLSIPDLWNNLQEIFCWFETIYDLLEVSFRILIPQRQTLNRLEQSQYPKYSYKRIDMADIVTKLIANAHSDVSHHLLDWRIEGNHEKNSRNLVAVEYQPTQLGQQNVSNRRGSAEIQRYCFRYSIFREIYPAMQHSIDWNWVRQASQMTPQSEFKELGILDPMRKCEYDSTCYFPDGIRRLSHPRLKGFRVLITRFRTSSSEG